MLLQGKYLTHLPAWRGSSSGERRAGRPAREQAYILADAQQAVRVGHGAVHQNQGPAARPPAHEDQSMHQPIYQ